MNKKKNNIELVESGKKGGELVLCGKEESWCCAATVTCQAIYLRTTVELEWQAKRHGEATWLVQMIT
jgi:hypothetical protein